MFDLIASILELIGDVFSESPGCGLILLVLLIIGILIYYFYFHS